MKKPETNELDAAIILIGIIGGWSFLVISVLLGIGLIINSLLK